MGAWGAVCVFDAIRFDHEVIPALRSTTLHPIIAAEIARGYGRTRFDLGALRGVEQIAPFLLEDLTGCSLGRDFWVGDGGILRRKPAAPRDAWGYEALCDLFERVVTRRCISHFANVGRTYRLEWSVSQECAEGVDDETQFLIEKLSSWGRYWAHGSGGYGEGINGWIDAAECRALARGLERARPSTGEDSGEDVADQTERIARIRRVAELAVSLDRGLLWGIDLAVLYPRWREYDGGEHTPSEIA